MKNLYFLLFACILFSSIAKAQTPQYHWMNQLGGPENEDGGFVSVDSKGCVYTASSIRTTAFFKPGSVKEHEFTKTSSVLNYHLVITKVDAAGNLIWSKQIGEYVVPSSITTDSHDNLVIAGIFKNSVDFNPGTGVFNMTEKGTGDIFILKLDDKGDFVWAGSIGSKKVDFPSSVVIDKKDNIALVCQFNDTLDVDMSSAIYNLIPTSSDETAVLKISSSGMFLWVHHLSGLIARALSFDDSGNLCSTGSFSGTKDFDFGSGTFNMTATGASGSEDAYALKVDTSGKFIWAKSFGEFVNNDNPYCITIDKSNNVIIAGFCGGGSSDFDPGPGVANLIGNNHFILKLSSVGNYVWVKGFNGSFDFTTIGVNDSNHVYTFGNFGVTMDFDPGTGFATVAPSSLSDGYVLRLDSNGLFNWVSQLKSTSNIYPSSAYVSGSGNVYVGGKFTLKADFDPGPVARVDSSWGKSDIFTLKLSRCLMNSTLSLSECKHFKLGGRTFDSSEIVDLVFTSALGCDSVVTVNMAIKSVNDTVSVSGSVLSAKSTTATSYQWVNCPAYSAIAGATSSTYTAGVSGNYALIVTENGCTDTSACVSVVGLSIQEAQQSEAISISPNPSKGMFNLSLPSEIKGQLEIKSIDGKLLYSELISSTKLTIDLSNYSSGLYILNVTDNKGKKIIEKLMKY